MNKRPKRYRRPVLAFSAENGALVGSFPSMHAVHLLGYDLRAVGRSMKTGDSIRGVVFRDAIQAASTGRNRES